MPVRDDATVALSTDVLVIGGGCAGMFAALYAARERADVLLIDKNFVGRGGATIMAQMTCASALAEAEPDSPDLHLQDTLEAGRGLCDVGLASLLCERSPERIRELAGWKVNWARAPDGSFSQVLAPGHSRKRCVYVDFLSTGSAICAALRNQTTRHAAIRIVNNLCLTDLVLRDGEMVGAVGFDVATSDLVTIEAKAVILCSGGMMKLFRRTTAPNNNSGDGLGMALRAGVEAIDVEFLQFYPNGHLAPRMVGLDPTTWEPTRVKLGGRLLNGQGEEFLPGYGDTSEGYSTTRDLLTYAITNEVAEGRGSPHGGVFLSFEHVPAQDIEKALGPVLGVFARNGIDLTKAPVEIAPIAHYQMGGIRVGANMATSVPGLYAAGEIVGGANGANRLSGNALPEAMVFGGVAGHAAARHVRRTRSSAWGGQTGANEIAQIRQVKARGRKRPSGRAPTAMLAELKELMWTKVGAFRTGEALSAAGDRIGAMRRSELDELSVGQETVHNASLVEWFELRNGLAAAEAVAVAGLNRHESRGAHQRTDCPETLDRYAVNQRVALVGDRLASSFESSPP